MPQILQKIVYELKYNRNKSSGYILGMELGYLIQKSIHNCIYDFIVPVPISKVKRNKRGYNQCELIAEGVSQILKVPIAFNYLIRNNNLNSQISTINFLGIQLKKGTFKTLLFSIIGILVLLLLFFIFKFKQSNSVTLQTKAKLKDIEDEYDEHRKRALEREQKVMRRLQDELNKQKKE